MTSFCTIEILLYDTKPTDSPASQSILSPITEVFDDRTWEKLDQPISLDELTKALESFEKNKTLGSDGLLAKLYSALWDLIDQDLLEVYDSILQAGTICESMRKGIITLMYKQEGEREEIRNLRPISLLNVNYKVLSKVIANQVRSVLGSVIHHDQTCAEPGRKITGTLVLLRDTITYVQDRGVDACVKSLDQKTFDRILHTYMRDVLSKLDFGERICNWIQLLNANMLTVPYHLSFMEKFLKKNSFDYKSIRQWSHIVSSRPFGKRTNNTVKDVLWSAQNLLVFQLKELTPTECCRLEQSKVQDYMLRGTLKLGTAAKA
eukprot:g47510.t1